MPTMTAARTDVLQSLAILEDARGLLSEAAAIPVRTRIATYPLAEATLALRVLKKGRINGAAVLIPAAP